ncbi:MAG: MFS transporter [Chloroflexi bacterium]|nr:MFS transporter [Chloroflexota bacterium]
MADFVSRPVAPPVAQDRTTNPRIILLFAIVVFFYWAGMYFYVPILPVYAQSLGASLETIGLLVGAYGFAQMVLRIPIGIASDRLGRRRVFVVGGCLAALVGAVALAVAPAPGWLVLGRGVVGIAASAYVALSVLFATYFPAREATRAMALIGFFGSTAQLFATTVGGWTAERFGWQAPMLIGACLAAGGIVVSLALPEPPARPNARLTVAAIRRVAGVRFLLAVAAASALAQYGTWGSSFSFVPIYAAGLGATPTELGLLLTVGLVPATLAPLTIAPLTRRWGDGRIVVAGLLLTALGTAVVPLTASLLSLAGSQLISGIGRGLSMPILMGLSIKTVAPEERATAMGFFQAIYAVGMFLGPATAGLVAAQLGLAGAFAASAACCVLGAVLAARAAPSR